MVTVDTSLNITAGIFASAYCRAQKETETGPTVSLTAVQCWGLSGVKAIIPAFVDVRFVEHGQIVGRLLAGYGELELEVCKCVANAGQEQTASERQDTTLKEFFALRGGERRIAYAIKKAAGAYRTAGLGDEFEATIKAMDYCRGIRNQFAHCTWWGEVNGDLGFTDLEAVIKLSNMWPLKQHVLRIDLPLLRRQEAFFSHVQRWFWHLEHEYSRRVYGNTAPAGWEMPTLSFPRPPLHK
jgi:hypothetical protein